MPVVFFAILAVLVGLWFVTSVLGLFVGLIGSVLSVTLGQVAIGAMLVAVGYGIGRGSIAISSSVSTSVETYDEKRGRWVDASKGKARRKS